MRGRTGGPFLLPVLVAWSLGGSPASGQETQPRITLSVTAGTLGAGELQTQPVVADRLEDGEVTETAALRRVIRASGGVRANVSVALALDPSWTLRVGGGVGRLTLEDAYAGADAWVEAARDARHEGHRDVAVTGVEGALRFRIPSAHAFSPYVELGMAAERWHSDTAPEFALPGAEGLLDGATRVAGHAALGGTYPLTGRISARLQASTHVFRTPIAPMAGAVEVGRSDTLMLTTAPPLAHGFADSAVELVRSTRLELGLAYVIAGPAAARTGRSGSSATPSVPPR